MSPTDLDEEIREALRDADEPPEPLRGRTPVRVSVRLSRRGRRPPRRRWWATSDWWLRTTASAAVGKLVGALLTGVGLLLAWLAAKAAGWIS